MLDPEEKADALNMLSTASGKHMLSTASGKLDGLSGVVFAWVDDKEGVLTFHCSGKNVVVTGMLTMILDDVKQGRAIPLDTLTDSELFKVHTKGGGNA